jgi:Mrp family chromosome partitioning ATPase
VPHACCPNNQSSDKVSVCFAHWKYVVIMNKIEKPTHTQVIGITSGKSGVGKTTVSVNLAVALHDMGYSVMILDANTSMANAQAALGSPCPTNLKTF